MRLPALALFVAFLAPIAARADDTAAPVIEHTPLTREGSGTTVLKVFARITDESKFFPQVFFRYGASSYEKPIDMKPVKGKKSEFGANVPVKGDTVEYYIEAYDEFGNGPGRAGDPDKPFKVTIGEQKVASSDPSKRDARAQGSGATSGAAAGSTGGGSPATSADARSSDALSPGDSTRSRARQQASASDAQPQRLWTWVVGGAGVGLLTGGLLAGLSAKSEGDAYVARTHDPDANPVTLQQQYDANKSLGTKATILTIGGLALIGGGVALYFLEGKTDDNVAPARGPRASGEPGHDVTFAAAPAQGGGAVAVAGRF